MCYALYIRLYLISLRSIKKSKRLSILEKLNVIINELQIESVYENTKYLEMVKSVCNLMKRSSDAL